MRKLLFSFGIIITFLSLAAAFSGKNHWYFTFAFGTWWIFDYTSHRLGNKTTLDLFFKNKWKFWQIFVGLYILGALIEVVGFSLIGWWDFLQLSFDSWIIFVIALYPIILISFREMFMTFKSLFENNIVSFINAMLLGIIIWEVPNFWSKDWIYTVPFGFDLFNLNIIVILGWVILIGGPLIVYRLFKA